MNNSLNSNNPKNLWIATHPATAPGTVTGNGPYGGIFSMPFLLSFSIEIF